MKNSLYQGVPSSPYKLNPLIGLGLLLFFANTFPWLGEEAGKQAATLAMISAGGGLLLIFRARSISLNNLPFGFLILYTIYVNVIIFVQIFLGGGNIIFNDLAEPLRVLGLLIFFILGAASSFNIRYFNLRVFFTFFLIISGWMILGWIIGGGFQSGIFHLYITRDGRFSGLMASVNYVWVPSVIMVVLALLYYDNKIIRKWLLILGVIILSMISILLSGSRTGIAGFLLALIVFFIFCGKKGRRKLVLVGLFCIGAVILLYNSMPDQFVSTFDRTAGRIVELTVAIQHRDLTEVEAFNTRLSIWESHWEVIEENLVFGHGSGKAGIRILDNNYLMTIYRYGIVGLILESMIYLSFLIVCFKNVRNYPVYSLPICFIAVYFISGVSSSPFYELKTPYVLAFLIGWFSSVSPRTNNYNEQKPRKYLENSKTTAVLVSC